MAANSRYGVTLKQLRELMEYRGTEGVQKIEDLGGSNEVVRKLNTSASAGLSGDRSDLEHRRDVFGSNTIPPKPPKTFLQVNILLIRHKIHNFTVLWMVNRLKLIVSTVCLSQKSELEAAASWET